MTKTVWGNCLVKNEDRYLYFAVMSVIDYLDKLLIWDTGSTDQTVKIINFLLGKFPGKIFFREYGQVDEVSFTRARQEMLQETSSDWLFLLDGDEVWWESSIRKLRQAIEKMGDDYNLIFNPTVNLVGDIYHYQGESAGQYKIAGKKGHFNIRAINRRIPGLHVEKPYGQEGYLDRDRIMIQDLDPGKILFIDAPYLHFTHLPRSSREDEVMQRARKMKYETGQAFQKNFLYPEVLNILAPQFIPDPWVRRPGRQLIRGMIQTPFKKLKRKITK